MRVFFIFVTKRPTASVPISYECSCLALSKSEEKLSFLTPVDSGYGGKVPGGKKRFDQ